jgi:hypothetical protein
VAFLPYYLNFLHKKSHFDTAKHEKLFCNNFLESPFGNSAWHDMMHLYANIGTFHDLGHEKLGDKNMGEKSKTFTKYNTRQRGCDRCLLFINHDREEHVFTKFADYFYHLDRVFFWFFLSVFNLALIEEVICRVPDKRHPTTI